VGVRFILASASPRRRELLREAGYDFDVVEPNLDEALEDGDPEKLVVRNALMKARAVAERFPDRYVLGADTIVYLQGRVIGKPADREDARRILKLLSGTEHEVVTGVALVRKEAGIELTGASRTRLRMKTLSAKEVESYVARGEGLGKAGAYAIQENGDKFIEELRGSFTNVVGLPLEVVETLFREIHRPAGENPAF
jgi:septum formation protein